MLQGEHSAILLTCIKLPFVIKIFVLSIFEWPLKTGFTVYIYCIGAREQPSMLEQSSADREIPTDQSSVCAELDRDPFMSTAREKEREKTAR